MELVTGMYKAFYQVRCSTCLSVLNKNSRARTGDVMPYVAF